MTDELYKLIHKPLSIKSKIRSREAQIKDLELMMMPSAIRYDKDKVQTSPDGDPMLTYTSRVMELEKEISNLKKEYLSEQKKLTDMIENVQDPNEQEVLILRYINGLFFETIAKNMPASISSVYRWHRIGINNMEELIKNGSK